MSQYFDVFPLNRGHCLVYIIKGEIGSRMIPVQFLELPLEIWVVGESRPVPRLNLINCVAHSRRVQIFNIIKRQDP